MLLQGSAQSVFIQFVLKTDHNARDPTDEYSSINNVWSPSGKKSALKGALVDLCPQNPKSSPTARRDKGDANSARQQQHKNATNTNGNFAKAGKQAL
jgi:hypothetical protein